MWSYRTAILALIASGMAFGLTPRQAKADADLAKLLDQRLDRARSLAESKDGDCAQRLEAARRDLDEVTANPALDIILPAGRARLTDIGYRLHIGRAYCGQATPLKEELLAALDDATLAVSLYRDLHDYQSMTIMQYDVAVTQQLMGDQDKAVLSLREALRQDGEYGFIADADENSALLARWTGEQPVAQDKASPRSMDFKFAWSPSDATVAIEADYLDLAGGTVQHSEANGTIERKIRADDGDWVLSSEPGNRHYGMAELGDATTPLKQALVSLAAERMLTPDVKISDKGEFEKAINPDGISAALVSDIETVAGKLPTEKEAEDVLEAPALMGLSAQLLTRPNGVSFKAEHDYDTAISAWIGATLEQGVWYDMQAAMLLPGMAVVMNHDIHFTYSRPVPCVEGTAEAACAEILVHAAPDPDALQKWLKALRGPFRLEGDDPAHYAAATDLRLVVDPRHLLPYFTEERRHWYFALEGKGEPSIGSEKTVATYTYRADSSPLAKTSPPP